MALRRPEPEEAWPTEEQGVGEQEHHHVGCGRGRLVPGRVTEEG